MIRPATGELIGERYRIVRLIGDGGMGSVYEARHEMLDVPVALKFLHPELARRTGLVERFLREARVSASIRSPHVTIVNDVARTPDGGAFLVMELLEGESLQQIMARVRPLHQDQAVDFALQMLLGLEAAHSLGVVHRDLKPDNVFVTPGVGGPIVKLLDFGIAKLKQCPEAQQGLTRPGAMLGTPEYMAPEQALSADTVDARADIYSLGAIVYEMLSGRRPAEGDDLGVILTQVRGGLVPRLEQLSSRIPVPLAQVIHQALHPDPTQRFDSARAMRTALARYAGALSQAGRVAATPVPAALVHSNGSINAEGIAPSAPQPLPNPMATPMATPSSSPMATPLGTASAVRATPISVHGGVVGATPTPPRPAPVGLRTEPMPHHGQPPEGAPRRLPLGAISIAALLIAGVAGAGLYLARGGGNGDPPPQAAAEEPPQTALAPMPVPEAIPVPLVVEAPPTQLINATPEPTKARAKRRTKKRTPAKRKSTPKPDIATPAPAPPVVAESDRIRRGGEIVIRLPPMEIPQGLPDLPTSFPEFPRIDLDPVDRAPAPEPATAPADEEPENSPPAEPPPGGRHI